MSVLFCSDFLIDIFLTISYNKSEKTQESGADGSRFIKSAAEPQIYGGGAYFVQVFYKSKDF